MAHDVGQRKAQERLDIGVPQWSLTLLSLTKGQEPLCRTGHDTLQLF
jgi:hypothetical protein